jgi:hypothetical protein
MQGSEHAHANVNLVKYDGFFDLNKVRVHAFKQNTAHTKSAYLAHANMKLAGYNLGTRAHANINKVCDSQLDKHTRFNFDEPYNFDHLPLMSSCRFSLWAGSLPKENHTQHLCWHLHPSY